MSEEQEQNKSEEPTAFKLRRAREKGTVARGMDLGYLGGLAALAAFFVIAGEQLVSSLTQLMRVALTAGISGAGTAGPQQGPAVAAALYRHALQPVLLLGATVMVTVLLLEVLQLRGFVFSAHPLKPDFSRLNPAKGLKRILSVRMVKESFKNVFKLAAYSTAAGLVILAAIEAPERASVDALGLAAAMDERGMNLLFLFIGLALFFAALDQVIVRREYRKQMRMSRREVTRENKDHEGEPRLKQKRKQLHAEYVKQSKGMAALPGSDLLVVNPQHFAVALRYDSQSMAAPVVAAKGRNHHALMLKKQAFLLGIPIFEDRPLARGLYEECEPGQPIGERRFQQVAGLYLKIHQPGTAVQ